MVIGLAGVEDVLVLVHELHYLVLEGPPPLWLKQGGDGYVLFSHSVLSKLSPCVNGQKGVSWCHGLLLCQRYPSARRVWFNSVILCAVLFERLESKIYEGKK